MSHVETDLNYLPLVRILKERKITYARLKREAHLTKEDIEALDTGKPLPAEGMYRICQYLNCDARDIFDFANRTLL